VTGGWDSTVGALDSVVAAASVGVTVAEAIGMTVGVETTGEAAGVVSSEPEREQDASVRETISISELIRHRICPRAAWRDSSTFTHFLKAVDAMRLR
jgi:hypothetical protein